MPEEDAPVVRNDQERGPMTAEIEQRGEEAGIVEPAIPGTLTATRLDLPPDLPRERWVEVGRTLRTMERGIQFWVGDWLAFGEDRYGEEAFAELERRDKTLANWATVSRRVHPSRRREDVQFSHHAAVAALPPEEQTEILKEAKEEDYTVRQTTERVREKQQARATTEAAETGRRVQHEAAPNYCAHCGSPESAWSRRPNDIEGSAEGAR